MTRSADEALLPVIRAALDQTRSAACITTAELDLPGPEIVYVNPAYCEMTGCQAEEVLGQTPRIMQGPLTSRPVLDRLRSDLEAGRPFEGETVNYRSDGRPYLISWRIDPVVDDEGVTTHFIATQEDITRLRRAERLLAAEQSIDRSVSTLLTRGADTDSNLQSLAANIRSAVAGLSDYGDVAISGSMRLGTSSAAFHAGPDIGGLNLTDSRTEAPYGARSGDHAGRLCVSCSLSNERTGVDGLIVVIDLDEAELDFTDRPGLERAAESARRALDSLAEYERQRFVAIELQRNLLPTQTPTVPGIEFAARYEPGAFATRVGGDWYDVFSDDERLVMVVGDIAGSGIRAASDMGRVRVLTSVLLQQGASVPEVFGSLNRFCSDEDLVATVLAVEIDRQSWAVDVVAAGHPPPVVRGSTAAHVMSLTPGPLLGIGGEPNYSAQPLPVGDHDIVVMFTDGLIEEATETIDVSLAKLAAKIANLPGDTDAVCDQLIVERLAGNPGDDIALLVFQLDRGRR